MPLVVVVKQLSKQRHARSLNLPANQNLRQPADIKDLESFSETTSRKVPAVCTLISSYTPGRPFASTMTTSSIYDQLKDCYLARLGKGLHFDKSHTGVIVQVAEVQEGWILDRVTEYCATYGKVFWEGKHILYMWCASFSMCWNLQDTYKHH